MYLEDAFYNGIVFLHFSSDDLVPFSRESICIIGCGGYHPGHWITRLMPSSLEPVFVEGGGDRFPSCWQDMHMVEGEGLVEAGGGHRPRPWMLSLSEYNTIFEAKLVVHFAGGGSTRWITKTSSPSWL